MEGLWMLYKAEGSPRDILSIEQFCMNNDVNYNEFYRWYKSMHHGIIPTADRWQPRYHKSYNFKSYTFKRYYLYLIL